MILSYSHELNIEKVNNFSFQTQLIMYLNIEWKFKGTLFFQNPVLTVGVLELYPAIYFKPSNYGGC